MSKITSNGIHHHANLLIGAPEEAESYLRLLCDGFGMKIANNPDFFAFRTSTFGIDEARELGILSARKAIATRKIFLISSARLTLEAQNALLKTFEDPFPDTHFFLAVREEGIILPTLRSRMQVVRLVQGQILNEAEEFLALSIKDRLLFARKFVDEEKSLSVFVDSLLALLRKQQAARELIKSVYNIRHFVNDTAAAPRLIIEHLSLVL